MILQTIGLSTIPLPKEDNNGINTTNDKGPSLDYNTIISKDDNKRSKIIDDEEMIFSMYWKEGIPSLFKRPNSLESYHANRIK